MVVWSIPAAARPAVHKLHPTGRYSAGHDHGDASIEGPAHPVGEDAHIAGAKGGDDDAVCPGGDGGVHQGRLGTLVGGDDIHP